jgi:predicted XRE-type DNA-binding protein
MEINRENLLAFIRNGLKSRSLTMSGLENLAKVPRDTIRDFMRGKTQVLRADKLQKIMSVLEPDPRVWVSGVVGAGAEIVPLEDNAAKEYIDCPPGCEPSGVVAARVRGDAMLPVFHDGWILYYSRRSDLVIPAISGGWQVPYAAPAKRGTRPFAEFLGKPCVVGLDDGRVLLGTLKRSASKNNFDLVNYNASDIRNIKPRWAAKIIFIKTQ